MVTSTAYTDVVRSSLSTSSSGGKRRAMARRTLRPRLNLSNSDGSWPSNESETALRVDPIRGIAKDVLLKLARELLRDAPVAGLLILLQPLPLPLLAPLSTNPLSVPVALLCTLPSGPLVAILCFMKFSKNSVSQRCCIESRDHVPGTDFGRRGRWRHQEHFGQHHVISSPWNSSKIMNAIIVAKIFQGCRSEDHVFHQLNVLLQSCVIFGLPGC